MFDNMVLPLAEGYNSVSKMGMTRWKSRVNQDVRKHGGGRSR